jgi:erythrocyte band 7 integral membrane protein
MRQAADILASKAAMQIRYLEAMQAMAKSSNSKVIFMPSAAGLNQSLGNMPSGAKENDLGEGTSAGPSGGQNSMFGITDPGFQQAINASIVENI